MKLNYIIIPLIAILTAGIGSLLTSGGMNWYKSINLPSWTPAGSIIGAVWTTIFILSAASALIVWNISSNTGQSRLSWIAGVFIANAVLNIFWSYLFFNQHIIAPAIFEAGILGLSVIALIVLIWPISELAALLLFPYAGWVCFATYLTYSVWLLNR